MRTLRLVPLTLIVLSFAAPAGAMFFVPALCVLSEAQGDSPFTYSISVEKNTHAIGEPIAVTFKLTNVSSSSQKIQKWRGPLAGVGVGKPDEFDFAVYRIIDANLARMDYCGMFMDGPPSYMILNSGAGWQETYIINFFLFPAYSLTEPGEYLMKSNYFSSPYNEDSDAFVGVLHAQDVKIKVVKLGSKQLRKVRRQLSEGKSGAIPIAALHRDNKAVPSLSKFCSNEDPSDRRRAHKALSVIGSDEALTALGQAASAESEYTMRVEITRLLADSGNSLVVPYLKKLLHDDYKSVVGIDGKRYYQYTVRKWASMALNKLGVTDDTTYLEELKEKIATLPDEQRNKLFSDSLSDNPSAQFDAVRELAISGYSPSSAEILAGIACDSNAPQTTRDYAAMGLGNFTNAIPADDKTNICTRLKHVLEVETLDTPDGIIRLLVKWEASDFVYKTLGERLKGHGLEVDVLAKIDGDYATDRLWQIYRDCPKGRKAEYYNKRASVGRALINKGDVRGIDILMELLPADNAPGPQYRNNVYCFLAIKIHNNFGYENGNYRPRLEEAIPKMIAWWEENRSDFKLASSRD
ncbi:MAG TPA: HEAT repeat domain-containing protein [Sedimentisphaerales bacterium]|nr:HEAT repeat domain-containing protein [Sedimentisphaerales bacterium]